MRALGSEYLQSCLFMKTPKMIIIFSIMINKEKQFFTFWFYSVIMYAVFFVGFSFAKMFIHWIWKCHSCKKLFFIPQFSFLQTKRFNTGLMHKVQKMMHLPIDWFIETKNWLCFSKKSANQFQLWVPKTLLTKIRWGNEVISEFRSNFGFIH